MIHVIIIKMSNQILQFKNTDEKYVHSTNLIILTHKYDAFAYPILCHDPVISNVNNKKSVKLVCRLVKYFLDAATNCILEVSVEL